jgi:hypothetical protein
LKRFTTKFAEFAWWLVVGEEDTGSFELGQGAAAELGCGNEQRCAYAPELSLCPELFREPDDRFGRPLVAPNAKIVRCNLCSDADCRDRPLLGDGRDNDRQAAGEVGHQG